MSSQYIFTMHRLSKEYPPDKQVLKDVNLQFLPGAKIGVLGYNGAGKSTVLKIMAGIETEYRGDAQLAPDATVGLLEQEPQLDETKDVKGNVEEAVTETKALLERFNELAANYSEETADEFARLQEQIDAADAWNLDTTIEYAMDALRLPPAAAPARPAAARRADQPPRRRVGGLAGAPSRRVQGHDRRRHARPLLPRQRRRLDPRARPCARDSLRGQLLVLAGAEAAPPRAGGEGRQGPPAHDRAGARVGSREPQGPAQEGQGTPEQLRGAARRGAQRQARPGPDPHPAGPAPGRRRDRGRGAAQGLRRPPADRGPDVQAPPGRDRRCDRAQRRREDDAVSHDHRPGAARRRRAARRRHRRAGLRRPVARRAGGRQVRLGGDLGRDGPDQGRRPHDELARVLLVV